MAASQEGNPCISTPSLAALIAAGESAPLEFECSTGELREAMQRLSDLANGAGGRVVVGVRPDGQIVDQQVSEQALHEIADARERCEPRVFFDLARVGVGNGREVLVFSVGGSSDSVPFNHDGRSVERVKNTTRRMSQDRYEVLLSDLARGRRGWENHPAAELPLHDTDPDEALRIVDTARSGGRLVGPIRRSLPHLLHRRGVRRRGSAAPTRPSASTSDTSGRQRSSCSTRPSASASGSSRCRAVSSPASSSASTAR